MRVERIEDQRYCGGDPCQKARKNAWRREKYDVDPDYRANQRASTEAWLASQGGSAVYYRTYRKRRKERQRKEQRRKEAHREDGQQNEPPASADPTTGQARRPLTTASANSDAKTPQSPVKSGRYRLLPYGTANSDAILVELSVIPTA